MRVTIEVARRNGGWDVSVLDPTTGDPLRMPETGEVVLAAPRALAEVGVGTRIFPLPPAAGPDVLPDGLQSTDLETVFQDVMNQAAGADGVVRFGQYLFNTLLGHDLWARIKATAAAEDTIELALTWPADSPLNRLPWEVMHSGTSGQAPSSDGLLAGKRGVLFTRRVSGTRDEAYHIEALPSPPRVLVAVGSDLTDPDIRAGAEYLGLLRALKAENRWLNTRLIVSATAGNLSQAIKEFRPTVVHIIGHGVDTDRGPSIEFRGEPGSSAADPVTATRLRDLLKTEDDLPLPSLVVLNACAPDVAVEVSVGRPLAAQLVQLGVPIVVGMSGNVADQACRLFTRGFYGTLLAGGEIARAAARGRRAGIAYGGYDAGSQIDWALPTLFMAEAVGAAVINVDVVDADLARLAIASEFTKRPDYPVFCGRWEFFTLYRELVSKRDKQFLVVPVDRSDTSDPAQRQRQFGSERLLQELAAQAIRDSHIPILVSKNWLDVANHRWPSTRDEFVDLIVKAVNRTVAILSGVSPHETLPGLPLWENLRRLRPSPGAPPEELPPEYVFGMTDDEKLAKALMLDLLALRKLIVDQRGLDEGANVKLLLLIEDYHDLVFGDSFLTALGLYGLRDHRASDRTRVILTYNKTPVETQSPTIKSIEEWARSHDVVVAPLGPLHGVIDPTKPYDNPARFQEAALIYQQFLMHWRHKDQAEPLSISPQNAEAVRALIGSLVYATAGGVPSELSGSDATTYIFTRGVIERGVASLLRPADDDAALAAEQGLPPTGGT